MKKWVVFFAVLSLGFIGFYSIPTKVQSFDEIYAKSDSISNSLNKFRKTPLKQLIVNGTKWTYLTIGKGDKTVLFLHGMTGSYDVWWQQINFLKPNYRIISLTYPPVNNLSEMGEAVISILNQEHIDQVILVGSSLGGYFTQYLMTKYPERVEKAVLGNTFPVNDQIKQENKNSEWLFKNAPEWLIMWAMRKGLYKDILPAGNNSKILEAMMLEQFSGGMSKDQFIMRYMCVIDKFKKKESANIPLLIIESDNDPLVKLQIREQLKVEYPQAKVISLKNAGHFPYLSHSKVYNDVLESFLNSEKNHIIVENNEN